MPLYFAYGSNLHWPQLKERCPSARFHCVAKLKDHRLAFTRKSLSRGCGVADVVPDQGHDVWGVVYEINEAELPNLDTAEGYRAGRARDENAYVREERLVCAEGDEDKPLAVLVYIAVKQQHPPPPDQAYKDLIVKGARHWHLPGAYIQELELIEVGP